MKRILIFLLVFATAMSLPACGGNGADQKELQETQDPFHVETVTPVKYQAVADIYFPTTGIVNPPTVVQTVTAETGFPDRDRSPAVCILTVDESLNVMDGDRVLTTVETFMALHRDQVIPAFYIDSEEEGRAVVDYLGKESIIDAYVVCHSNDAALLYQVRTTYKNVQGALWFDEISDADARKEALLLANRSLAAVICTDQPMTLADTEYFNARMVNLWASAAHEAEVYHAIASGYNGVLCRNTDMVFDIYESITTTTVCGVSIVVGHRGASAYLENTITSFRKAVEEYGCQAVELDLRLSSDNEIVIMHDETLERTTDSTGNVADLSVEQLKKARVVKGGEGAADTIPTFEEVLKAFAGTDVVLVCHINVANDVMLARFNQLVEQYACQDQIVVFGNTDKYNYTTYTPGLVYGAGNNEDVINVADPRAALYSMMKKLVPLHGQPLYYDYQPEGLPDVDHGTPAFYHMLCARGFLNWHSVTNGRKKVEKALLTDNGAAAILTDQPENAVSFCYAVEAEAQTLKVGQTVELSHNAVCQLGSKTVACDYTQLSGPTLEGDTLNSAGTVTVVFHADLRTDGGIKYRIYSTPVEITFE